MKTPWICDIPDLFDFTVLLHEVTLTDHWASLYNVTLQGFLLLFCITNDL